MPPVKEALAVAEWGASRLAPEMTTAVRAGLEAGAKLAGEAIESTFGPNASAIARSAGRLLGVGESEAGAAATMRASATEYTVKDNMALTMGRIVDPHAPYSILGGQHAMRFSPGIQPLARVADIMPGAGAAENRFGFLFLENGALKSGQALGNDVAVLGRQAGERSFTNITPALNAQFSNPLTATHVPAYRDIVAFRANPAEKAGDTLGWLTHIKLGN